MLKLNTLKVLVLISIIFLSMGFIGGSEEKLIDLSAENSNFYQENLCNYTIFDLMKAHSTNITVEFRNDPSGSVECFGKNSWLEYIPPKPIEREPYLFEEEKIRIWLSTNLSVDILVQSLFWLILFTFIPKIKEKEFSKKYILILLNTILFYIHLVGEKEYYKYFSRDFDSEILSREFNGNLYYENYYLYFYLLAIAFISYVALYLLESRFFNLINYSPFVFLFYGTFTGLNLNIYLIIIGLLGLHSLIHKGANRKLTLAYFVFSVFWIINLNQKDIIFDVDKLRGFVNSSQSLFSLIYWTLIFYFLINGIIYLVQESKEFFSLNIFKRNLIITGSSIFIFGNLAAISKFFNYFSFYFLGLNKFGMRSIESISGNTWRGIAPSAEGMGEFFAFILLFISFILYEKKSKLILIEYAGLALIIFGLIRANNFAAISSFIFLFIFYVIYTKFKGIKLLFIFSFLFLFFASLSYSFIFKDFSYDNLSNRILYEAVAASDIQYNQETNQYGWDQARQANYKYILEIPKENSNLSSSLRFSLEQYTYNNIDNLPSVISIINIGSYFINRAEKWGIFLSKYNPDSFELLFGYGPQQFTEYYFDHPTEFNYGLFLPHSSILNYLLFFGIFGLLILSKIIYSQVSDKKIDLYNKFLIIYFVLNFIKSDSLFYFPNLFLFVIVLSSLNTQENYE